MSDIEQHIEQKETKKLPKMRKDGKTLDRRSFNRPPVNNAMTARERLSYLLKKGKESIQQTKVDKKVIKPNGYEQLQSDNEGGDHEETDIERPKTQKKKKPELNTRKKKKQPKIVVEEDSDDSEYEEESEEPDQN